MPGAGRSDSPTLQYVGLAVAVIAVVGWLVAGWEFGSGDGLLPTAIAAACVVLGVGVAVYRRVA